jgi:NAD(P)-dependent dehydrogenase (short-subunit alcohol dehydrogenase family)
MQITTAASVLVWLNDWLSTKSANNWITDKSWDWKKEVVVVTGGSGGIGAGVAQRLAAMGARVVVLDIIPLTYKPGLYLSLSCPRNSGEFRADLLMSTEETNRIMYHKCDLSDEKEIAAVCDKIRVEVGDPTVLRQ